MGSAARGPWRAVDLRGRLAGPGSPRSLLRPPRARVMAESGTSMYAVETSICEHCLRRKIEGTYTLGGLYC